MSDRTEALSRAQEALMAHNHARTEGQDGREVCWRIAIEVDRALRGAVICRRCRGTGMPGPEGDACDHCDGSGEFDPADSTPEEWTAFLASENKRAAPLHRDGA